MRTQTHMGHPSIPSHNCCYPELSGRWVDHCCKTSFDSMAVNDSTRIPHLINLKEKFRERKTHTCHQLQDNLWVSTPCSLFCVILQTWWDNLLLMTAISLSILPDTNWSLCNIFKCEKKEQEGKTQRFERERERARDVFWEKPSEIRAHIHCIWEVYVVRLLVRKLSTQNHWQQAHTYLWVTSAPSAHLLGHHALLACLLQNSMSFL